MKGEKARLAFLLDTRWTQDELNARVILQERHKKNEQLQGEGKGKGKIAL